MLQCIGLGDAEDRLVARLMGPLPTHSGDPTSRLKLWTAGGWLSKAGGLIFYAAALRQFYRGRHFCAVAYVFTAEFAWLLDKCCQRRHQQCRRNLHSFNLAKRLGTAKRRQADPPGILALRMLCHRALAAQPKARLKIWSASLKQLLPPAPASRLQEELVAEVAASGDAEKLVVVCKGLPQLTELDLLPVAHALTSLQLQKIMRTCPQLQKLSLRNCWQADEAVYAVLREQCQKLEELDLRGCRRIDQLRGAAFPSLRRLNLELCYPHEAYQLLSSLAAPLLEEVWLPKNCSLPPGAEQPGAIPARVQLHFPFAEPTHRALVATRFPVDPVASLHLDAAAYWEEPESARVPAWAAEELKELSLYNCGTDVVKIFSEFCEPLLSLTRLCVELNEKAAFHQLVQKLPRSLERLELHCSSQPFPIVVGDEDIIALAECCPHLTALSLDAEFRFSFHTIDLLLKKVPKLCRLRASLIRPFDSENGAFNFTNYSQLIEFKVLLADGLAWADALEHCPNLEVLLPQDPALCPGSTRRIDQILACRKEPSRLRTIGLRCTTANVAAICKILERLPNLEELWVAAHGSLTPQQWVRILKAIPGSTDRLMLVDTSRLEFLELARMVCPQITSMGVWGYCSFSEAKLEEFLTEPSHLRHFHLHVGGLRRELTERLAPLRGPFDHRWSPYAVED
jgi:hypothetical protein